MRRGCFLSVIGLLGLCLVACALLYFVGLPRFRDSAREEMQNVIGTAVARQIPAPAGGQVEPGTYTLTEADLEGEIQGNVDVQNVDDLNLELTPGTISFVIQTDQDQDVNYSGNPVAENGRLVMTNMESSDGFLNWIFPADDLGQAIEDAVNEYLTVNDLQLASVEVTDGELTLETVPAT